MTADYLDDVSSRKKYLAPLVVIMLCAVALTGAAYAYSTTVTGNGDIKGEYTIIDIYKNESGEYKATSSFDITQNNLTFYTVTDKTGSTAVYKAYLEDDGDGYARLIYKTYLRINTTDSTSKTQQFSLGEFKFTYTAPQGCGSIRINGYESGEQSIDWGAITIYDVGTGKKVEDFILTENTIYSLEITLNVTGGIEELDKETYYFCIEDTAKAVQDKVNTFNTTKNELTIKITASEADTGTASGDGSS